MVYLSPLTCADKKKKAEEEEEDFEGDEGLSPQQVRRPILCREHYFEKCLKIFRPHKHRLRFFTL